MAVHYSQFQQQQQLQFRMASALAGCGAGAGGPAPDQTAMLFPQTVAPPPQVFSEPVSELTCNVSGSRKRAREDEPLVQETMTANSTALLMYQQQLMLQKQYQQQLLQNQIRLCKPQPDTAVDNTRICQSIMTSTSGRPTATPYNNTATTGLPSPSSTLISLLLNQQGLEVDDLIRNHADNLRSSLHDARKRQCRAVISSVARQAQARIARKQAEVEAAEKRNAELQERLRQAFAESQAWFNVARNSEAVITSLRDNLEQALVQNLSVGAVGANKTLDLQVEGYGDSWEDAVTAASSSTAVPCPLGFAEVSKPASAAGAVVKNLPTTAGISLSPCKSCAASDGSIIVLPCRHLCLCQSCEPTVVECPVCHGLKSGSFQINLS